MVLKMVGKKVVMSVELMDLKWVGSMDEMLAD
jgi:hypothetical protein